MPSTSGDQSFLIFNDSAYNICVMDTINGTFDFLFPDEWYTPPYSVTSYNWSYQNNTRSFCTWRKNIYRKIIDEYDGLVIQKFHADFDELHGWNSREYPYHPAWLHRQNKYS